MKRTWRWGREKQRPTIVKYNVRSSSWQVKIYANPLTLDWTFCFIFFFCLSYFGCNFWIEGFKCYQHLCQIERERKNALSFFKSLSRCFVILITNQITTCNNYLKLGIVSLIALSSPVKAVGRFLFPFLFKQTNFFFFFLCFWLFRFGLKSERKCRKCLWTKLVKDQVVASKEIHDCIDLTRWTLKRVIHDCNSKSNSRDPWLNPSTSSSFALFVWSSCVVLLWSVSQSVVLVAYCISVSSY